MAIPETRINQWRAIEGIGQDTLRASLIEHADPLDRLAFYTGFIREPHPETGLILPFNWRLYTLVDGAREVGYSWPEISEAHHNGGAERDWRRVQQRQLDHAKTLARLLAEHSGH